MKKYILVSTIALMAVLIVKHVQAITIDSTLSPVASYTSNNANLDGVSWINHNGTVYVATGGAESGTDGAEIRVFQFNCSHPGLTLLTSFTGANTEIFDVEWKECGNSLYLAACGNKSPVDNAEIRIFNFNTTSNTLTQVATNTVQNTTVFTLAWHDCNNSTFLAVGGFEGSPDGKELRIFNFDCATQALTQVANFAQGDRVLAVSWLDLNNTTYLAIGGQVYTITNNEQIKVLEFNCAAPALTQICSFTYFNVNVFALDWHVCNNSAYLAAGGAYGPSTSNIVRILDFNATNSILNSAVVYSGNDNGIGVTGVLWHECDSSIFLAIGGDIQTDNSNARVMQFTCTAPALTQVASFTQQSSFLLWHPLAWGSCCSTTYLSIVGVESPIDNASLRVLKFATGCGDTSGCEAQPSSETNSFTRRLIEKYSARVLAAQAMS